MLWGPVSGKSGSHMLQSGDAHAPRTPAHVPPPRSPTPQLAMQALSAMAALFAATAHPGCLEVVVEALEMQYEQPGMPAAAMQALAAACDTALPRLQVRGGLGKRWDSLQPARCPLPEARLRGSIGAAI